jgi:hypothetical protein
VWHLVVVAVRTTFPLLGKGYGGLGGRRWVRCEGGRGGRKFTGSNFALEAPVLGYGLCPFIELPLLVCELGVS